MNKTRFSRSIKAIKVDFTPKRCPIDSDRCVIVKSVDDYFNLPLNRREQYGFWYKLPQSFENYKDWKVFNQRIRRAYPIQGWLRTQVFTEDNPVCRFFWSKQKDLSDFWYKIKCFFKPQHKMIREAIPNTWTDITSLIVDVNFAMIRDFYHNEVVDGHVDWHAGPDCDKFYRWLKRAIKYIEVDRPKLLEDISNSYPDLDIAKENLFTSTDRKTYEELYGAQDKLEAILQRKDTNILKQMIDYRDIFWT
jgi:hypothetical protein